MRIFSVQGANIVVGGKRIIFAPFTPVELPQETADYLLSTGRLYKEGETPKELAADLIVRPIKIGVHRIGGFGDALLGSCVITALARKFPSCQITAHTHSTIQKLWLGHPKIHHQDSGYHPRLNNSPYSVQGYDAFFNLMPDCYVEYNKRTMPAELVAMAQHARAEIDRYKKMPGVLNHLKPFCRDRNFEALDVFNFCFGTDAKVTDMYFNQTEKDKTCYDRFVKDKIIPEKYITIHDWAFNGRQTKSWFPNYWKELNSLLKKEYKLPLVQIGGAGEERLGADYCLLGRTTWGESVELLKHSSLHIDNESTPAHVCPAVGTPCAILCGPTLKYWRHRENLNIVSPYACQECEGSANWYKVCSDKNSFQCMKSITPDYAFQMIKENYSCV